MDKTWIKRKTFSFPFEIFQEIFNHNRLLRVITQYLAFRSINSLSFVSIQSKSEQDRCSQALNGFAIANKLVVQFNLNEINEFSKVPSTSD